MQLHTKLVLSVSLFLIAAGTLLLFVCERGTGAYQDLTLSEQVAASAFQSVSARTAGFNSVNLSALTQTGRFLIISLMLIGGSPGSTAGGIKNNNLLPILVLSVITTFRSRKSTEVFGRRLEDFITRKATCIFFLYITFSFSAAMIISRIENIDF